MQDPYKDIVKTLKEKEFHELLSAEGGAAMGAVISEAKKQGKINQVEVDRAVDYIEELIGGKPWVMGVAVGICLMGDLFGEMNPFKKTPAKEKPKSKILLEAEEIIRRMGR